MSNKLIRLLRIHVPLDDSWDDVPEGHVMCNSTDCSFTVEMDEDNHWRDTFAEHVAAALTVEGFGNVQEAKAATLEEEAAAFHAQSETYLATSQTMVGSPDHDHDDIVRYGAYASAAQSAGHQLTRRAKAIRGAE